jgi:hypothetical protein
MCEIKCGWCNKAEATNFTVTANKFVFSHCDACWQERKNFYRGSTNVNKQEWLAKLGERCWTPPKAA